MGFKWEQTSKMVNFWIEAHHKNAPTNPKMLINNNYNCTMVPAFDSFFIFIGLHWMEVSIIFCSTSAICTKGKLVSLLAYIPPSVVSFDGLRPYCQGQWTIVAIHQWLNRIGVSVSAQPHTLIISFFTWNKDWHLFSNYAIEMMIDLSKCQPYSNFMFYFEICLKFQKNI